MSSHSTPKHGAKQMLPPAPPPIHAAADIYTRSSSSSSAASPSAAAAGMGAPARAVGASPPLPPPIAAFGPHHARLEPSAAVNAGGLPVPPRRVYTTAPAPPSVASGSNHMFLTTTKTTSTLTSFATTIATRIGTNAGSVRMQPAPGFTLLRGGLSPRPPDSPTASPLHPTDVPTGGSGGGSGASAPVLSPPPSPTLTEGQSSLVILPPAAASSPRSSPRDSLANPARPNGGNDAMSGRLSNGDGAVTGAMGMPSFTTHALPGGGSILTPRSAGLPGGISRTTSRGEMSMSMSRQSVVSFVVPPSAADEGDAVMAGGCGVSRQTVTCGDSGAGVGSSSTSGVRVSSPGRVIVRPQKKAVMVGQGGAAGSRTRAAGGGSSSSNANGGNSNDGNLHVSPAASFRDRIQQGYAAKRKPTAVRRTARHDSSSSSLGSSSSSSSSVGSGLRRRRSSLRGRGGGNGAGGSRASRRGSLSSSRTVPFSPADRFAILGFAAIFRVKLMAVVMRQREEAHFLAVTGPCAAFVIQCCWRRYKQRQRLRRLAALCLLQPWLRFRLGRMRKRKEASARLLQRVFRGEQTRSLTRFLCEQMHYNAALSVVRRFILRWEAQIRLRQLKLQREERNLLLDRCRSEKLRLLREERGIFLDMVRAGASVLGVRPCVPAADYIAYVVALTECAPVIVAAPDSNESESISSGARGWGNCIARRRSVGLPFPGELSRSSTSNAAITAAQVLSPISSCYKLPMRLPRSRRLCDDLLGTPVSDASVRASTDGSATSSRSFSTAFAGRQGADGGGARGGGCGKDGNLGGSRGGRPSGDEEGRTRTKREDRSTTSGRIAGSGGGGDRLPSSVATTAQALVFLQDLFRAESACYLDCILLPYEAMSNEEGEEREGAKGEGSSAGLATGSRDGLIGVAGDDNSPSNSAHALTSDSEAAGGAGAQERSAFPWLASSAASTTATPATTATQNALALLPLVLEAVTSTAPIPALMSVGSNIIASTLTTVTTAAAAGNGNGNSNGSRCGAPGAGELVSTPTVSTVAAGTVNSLPVGLPRPPACLPSRGGGGKSIFRHPTGIPSGRAHGGETAFASVMRTEPAGSNDEPHPPLLSIATGVNEEGGGMEEEERSDCTTDGSMSPNNRATTRKTTDRDAADDDTSTTATTTTMAALSEVDDTAAADAAALAMVLPGVQVCARPPRILRGHRNASSSDEVADGSGSNGGGSGNEHSLAGAPPGSSPVMRTTDGARVVVRLGRRRQSGPLTPYRASDTEADGRASRRGNNRNATAHTRQASKRRSAVGNGEDGDRGSDSSPPSSFYTSDNDRNAAEGMRWAPRTSRQHADEQKATHAPLSATAAESDGDEEDGVLSAFITLLCRTEAIERITLQQSLLEERATLLQPILLTNYAIQLRRTLAVPPLYAPLLLAFHDTLSMRWAAKLFVEEQRQRLALLESYDALPLAHLRRPVFSTAAESRRRMLVGMGECVADPLPKVEAEEAAFFAQVAKVALEGRPRPAAAVTSTAALNGGGVASSPPPLALSTALEADREANKGSNVVEGAQTIISKPPSPPRRQRFTVKMVPVEDTAEASTLGGRMDGDDTAIFTAPTATVVAGADPLPTAPPRAFLPTMITVGGDDNEDDPLHHHHQAPHNPRRPLCTPSLVAASAPSLSLLTASMALPQPRRRHRGPPIPLLRSLDPHIAAASRHHRRLTQVPTPTPSPPPLPLSVLPASAHLNAALTVTAATGAEANTTATRLPPPGVGGVLASLGIRTSSAAHSTNACTPAGSLEPSLRSQSMRVGIRASNGHGNSGNDGSALPGLFTPTLPPQNTSVPSSLGRQSQENGLEVAAASTATNRSGDCMIGEGLSTACRAVTSRGLRGSSGGGHSSNSQGCAFITVTTSVGTTAVSTAAAAAAALHTPLARPYTNTGYNSSGADEDSPTLSQQSADTKALAQSTKSADSSGMKGGFASETALRNVQPPLCSPPSPPPRARVRAADSTEGNGEVPDASDLLRTAFVPPAAPSRQASSPRSRHQGR